MHNMLDAGKVTLADLLLLRIGDQPILSLLGDRPPLIVQLILIGNRLFGLLLGLNLHHFRVRRRWLIHLLRGLLLQVAA